MYYSVLSNAADLTSGIYSQMDLLTLLENCFKKESQDLGSQCHSVAILQVL